MDIISELPDDLLSKILSYVPTKTAISTQILSKRWLNVWRMLPNLSYDWDSHQTEYDFNLFIHTTMKLIESPVLERLYLKIGPDILNNARLPLQKLLIEKSVRELEVTSAYCGHIPLFCRISLSKTLLILKLDNLNLSDQHLYNVGMQSLRTLQFRRVKYQGDVFLSRLLSCFPSLQDLTLDRCSSSIFIRPTVLRISVPSLQRLTVHQTPESYQSAFMRLIIIAPSLKYLNVQDYRRKVFFGDENMPDLVEADLNVTRLDTKNLLKSLRFVKRLSLCLITPRIRRETGDGISFKHLVRLELCTCQKEWWNLLGRTLLVSPNLRFLKFHQKHCFGIRDPVVRWKKPSCVPECLLSSLETFVWIDYEGTVEEKELATYILKNAKGLKKAVIAPVNLHQGKRPRTCHVFSCPNPRSEISRFYVEKFDFEFWV